MSVPTHGIHCNARTFPMKCTNCGDEVFYFSCNCGSKVFFDELGPPWPVHDCAFSKSDRDWARSRPKRKFGSGGVQVDLSPGVTATRPPEIAFEWHIDPVVEHRERNNARSRKLHPIESVPPGADSSVEIAGVVREVRWHVDVYASLKVPRTPVSEGFLGPLGSGVWSKITVHVLEDLIYSYTAWVATAALRQNAVTRDAAVSAVLHRQDVGGKAREWVCEGLATLSRS